MAVSMRNFQKLIMVSGLILCGEAKAMDEVLDQVR